MVTQSLLHELFDYREDGNLVRRVAVRGPGGQVGRCIGSVTTGGKDRPDKKYMITKIAGQHYCVHKLIYLYHHGYMPEQVDHINRNSLDNRVENMRAATGAQNMANRSVFKNNTSGVKGVSWHSGHKKWSAYVNVAGKRKHLGYCDDIAQAAKLVQAARDQLHGDYAAQS